MKTGPVVYFSAVLLLVAGLVTLSSPVSASQERQWRFEVFLDEQPIGYHDFRLVPRGSDSHQLQIDARFDVKFLFFSAYRYRHRNSELWRDQCLQQIEARTNDNGQEYIVRGTRNANVFEVASQETAFTVNGCIKTFAYWDPSILQADRLLNAQTGEFVDIETAALGEETIRVRDELVRANRYRLTGEGISIDLWYAADSNRWLALQSTTDSGRKLSYRMI